MPSAPRRVLVLADRIDSFDAARIEAWIHTWKSLGFDTRLLARQGADRLPQDQPHYTLPDFQRLASRMWWLWSRLPSIRQDFPFDLMVVLGLEPAEWAIPLAERAAVPYLMLVEDEPFTHPHIRASRHWCRAIVANDAHMADQLAQVFHVPPALLHVVEPASCWIGPPASDARRPAALHVLGTVGAGGRAGLAHLLETTRGLTSEGLAVELVLDPEPADLSHLRLLAQREGLEERITVVDSLERDTLFWSVLDLYVEPALGSRTRRSLRRATQAGIPWIAAGLHAHGLHPAAPELGTRIAANEPDALAHAIRTALQANPAPRSALLPAAAAPPAPAPAPSPEALALAQLFEEALEPSRRLRVRRDHAPSRHA